MTRRRTTVLLVATIILAVGVWIAGVFGWPSGFMHGVAEFTPVGLVVVLAACGIYTLGLSRQLDSASREARGAVMEAAAKDALLGAVVHTASDAIITSDAAGSIRTFNAGAETMFGIQASPIIARNASSCFLIMSSWRCSVGDTV